MKIEIKDIHPGMVNPLGMLMRKAAYCYSSRYALIGVNITDIAKSTGYTGTDIAMRLQGANPWINGEFVDKARGTKTVQDSKRPNNCLNYVEKTNWFEYSMRKENASSITLGDFGELFDIQNQDMNQVLIEFALPVEVEMILFIEKVDSNRTMEDNANAIAGLKNNQEYSKSSSVSFDTISLPSENCKQTIQLIPETNEVGSLTIEMDMPTQDSQELRAKLKTFFSTVLASLEEPES